MVAEFVANNNSDPVNPIREERSISIVEYSFSPSGSSESEIWNGTNLNPDFPDQLSIASLFPAYKSDTTDACSEFSHFSNSRVSFFPPNKSPSENDNEIIFPSPYSFLHIFPPTISSIDSESIQSLNVPTTIHSIPLLFPPARSLTDSSSQNDHEINLSDLSISATFEGKISWPSGAIYEGELKSGQMDGFGTFIGSNGDSYSGSWKSNQKHGYGQKRYANGDLYEGYWKQNLQGGQGRYIWKYSGDEYIGQWKKGKISGRGVLKRVNGNIYDGVWERDSGGFWHVYK